MPSRKVPFVNDEIYHIYNRGNEKRIIFDSSNYFKRFLKTLKYYQHEGPKPKLSRFFDSSFKLDPTKKIVEIIGYCLMPNHFHLLIKQIKDGGITEFVSKLSNSYTKYYNTKNNRVGSLFQGEFKSVHIDNYEQLIHVHRYIHLNPVVSYLAKKPEDYEWSSYSEFSESKQDICLISEILALFASPEKYQEFVNDQIEYGQTLERLKHQLLEEV